VNVPHTTLTVHNLRTTEYGIEATHDTI